VLKPKVCPSSRRKSSSRKLRSKRQRRTINRSQMKLHNNP
jgi:hypothetical protein